MRLGSTEVEVVSAPLTCDFCVDNPVVRGIISTTRHAYERRENDQEWTSRPTPEPMPAKYVGATMYGTWSYLCEYHMNVLGFGVGQDIGARLMGERQFREMKLIRVAQYLLKTYGEQHNPALVEVLARTEAFLTR